MRDETDRSSGRPLVVVTGATGFLGSRVRHQLAAKFDVLAVDLVRATDARASERWCVGDVTEPRFIERFFSAIERPLSGLVHLAWSYDFSNRPHRRYDAAIDGMAPLVEAFSAAAHPDAPFVFASSMAAVAPTEPGKRLTPASPSSEAWQYPRSKARAERALRAKRIGQPRIELVLAGIYSDFCELVPLYQAIERIRGGSFQRWFFPGRTDRGLTYVHVDDAASAVVAALRARYQERDRVHRFLVGEPEPVTNQTIFDATSKAFGRARVPKVRVPRWLAVFGAWVANVIGDGYFVQPWMIPFAEEHFAFDLSETETRLHWQSKVRLTEFLPTMLANARHSPEAWKQRNERRPWRAIE